MLLERALVVEQRYGKPLPPTWTQCGPKSKLAYTDLSLRSDERSVSANANALRVDI